MNPMDEDDSEQQETGLPEGRQVSVEDIHLAALRFVLQKLAQEGNPRPVVVIMVASSRNGEAPADGPADMDFRWN